MAYRITPKSSCLLMVAVLMTLCTATLPVSGQDVRVALQSKEADESVDDDPADKGEPVVVPETADDEKAETLTPAERSQALDRRAGEQVGDNPRGRAIVLGMHIQEGDSGRAKVVEVAAASPAFDAGLREGDEIVSFDGFTGKSYRDWIDGIRKLVTDTPDGATIAVDVLRGGKRVGLKVLAPQARADDPRVPGLLGQRIEAEGAVGGGLPIPVGPNQPLAPGIGSDNDVFISDGPLFGNELDDAFSGATDRAMAEIRRLDEPQQAAQRAAGAAANSPINFQADAPRPVPVAPAQPGAQAQAGVPAAPGPEAATAARIGLAGFRDDQNGMLVMLDVGGLAPGNYRVSIDDPSLVMGSSEPTVPTVAPQAQARQPLNQQVTGTVSADGSSVGTTGAGTPAGVVGGGTTPSGSRIPPSGQVNPNAGAPPSGRVLPPAATPTGLPNPEAAAPTQPGRPGAQALGANGAATSTLSEIGVLTVDQSGTGRLQQVVEGVQVRNVVGQAILIYPPVTPPETTVPPNTNVSGVAGDGVDLRNAGQARGRASPSASRQVPGSAAQPRGNAIQIAGQANMPIAGGVIRLMSDRRPQDAAPAATTDGIPQAANRRSQQDQPLAPPTADGGRAAAQNSSTEQTPTR